MRKASLLLALAFLTVGPLGAASAAGTFAGGLTVSAGDASITEGTGTATYASVNVTLSQPCQQEVTVGYQTGDGSALAPADYGPVQGTLVFAPGETQKTVQVPINGDGVHEATESLYVYLTQATIASVGDGIAEVTVYDDDPEDQPKQGDEGINPSPGCKCTALEILKPKHKKPEAHRYSAGGVRWVTVKIPIAARVQCTPGDPTVGCGGRIAWNGKTGGISWDTEVKTVNIQPNTQLNCPGKCDGLWHRSETHLVYQGWVKGAWPTHGTIKFRAVEGNCGPKNSSVVITAKVTFTGGMTGDVDVHYDINN